MSKSIFIITGKVGSGKTTRLGELITELRQTGIHLAGFLSQRNLRSGERTGYSLVNVMNESELLFASTGPREGWPHYGRFFFNPKAFSEGEKIIKKAIADQTEMVIIDEVGPLELKGEGWATMLQLLRMEKNLIQLWTVRESILEQVLEKWDIPGDRVFHLGHEDKEDTLNKIYSACQK